MYYYYETLVGENTTINVFVDSSELLDISRNYTVVKPPPLKEKQCAILATVNAKPNWEIWEDHRGEKGIVDEGEVEITLPGPLPENWVSLSEAPSTELTLEQLKEKRKKEIDTRTNLIKERDGFSFMGKNFSLTDNAMIKWNGLLGLKDKIPYPMYILTLRDEPFALVGPEMIEQFVMSAFVYETLPTSPVNIGRSLRQQIDAAISIEDVNVVIDTRQ